ncbi:Acetoin utilization protein AcuC [Corynebacterium kalinowskii]|uniref:Acetoin utilization protein AcuC n=1 Tax=Corynebacterium kalinowskii TaxID=2675216 RepID=A0A6B8VHT3_9CORY|nr:acetoin utilization protein AcuC [Corynebacterium kalinowskii]QGU01154.1 Acetoin utilization protein AcuC [Corynebacterium kalinowskii]
MKPLLLLDDALYGYNLGDTHPMGADRVRLAVELADYFGILSQFDIEVPRVTPRLELVHTPAYLEAVRSGEPSLEHGIGVEDNPVITPRMATIGAAIVAGTVSAAEEVWSGRRKRAVNIAGGLHHAHASRMSGFCMYNDAGIAIRSLLDQGAQRVAYIDVDAHHGDGVEQEFWNDPRVLTISIHESGLYLFPGTGFAHDIGGPSALGTAVNIALDREAGDEEWLRASHSVIPQILKVFRPEIIISQHGADPHRDDPLADLQLSVDALYRAYSSIGKWADRYASGRWVALGGGGYQRDSVARIWVALLAAVAGVPFEPSAPMPHNWSRRVGAPCSVTWGDPESLAASLSLSSISMDGTATPAMKATSRAVFPYWGLQPYG